MQQPLSSPNQWLTVTLLLPFIYGKHACEQEQSLGGLSSFPYFHMIPTITIPPCSLVGLIDITIHVCLQCLFVQYMNLNLIMHFHNTIALQELLQQDSTLVPKRQNQTTQYRFLITLSKHYTCHIILRQTFLCNQVQIHQCIDE